MALPTSTYLCPSRWPLVPRAQVGAGRLQNSSSSAARGMRAVTQNCPHLGWGRGRVMAMAAKKQAGQFGDRERREVKLEEVDLMELEFGRLLGESRQSTLAKVIGRKANPDVPYLEIEKSGNKRQKLPGRDLLETDFSRLLNREEEFGTRGSSFTEKGRPAGWGPIAEKSHDLPGLAPPPARPGMLSSQASQVASPVRSKPGGMSAQGNKGVPLVTFGPGGYASQSKKPKADEDNYKDLVRKPMLSSEDSIRPSWPTTEILPYQLMRKVKQNVPQDDRDRGSDGLLRRPKLRDLSSSEVSVSPGLSEDETHSLSAEERRTRDGVESVSSLALNSRPGKYTRENISPAQGKSGFVVLSPDMSEERFAKLLELAGTPSTEKEQDDSFEASTARVIASNTVPSKKIGLPKLGLRPSPIAHTPSTSLGTKNEETDSAEEGNRSIASVADTMTPPRRPAATVNPIIASGLSSTTQASSRVDSSIIESAPDMSSTDGWHKVPAATEVKSVATKMPVLALSEKPMLSPLPFSSLDEVSEVCSVPPDTTSSITSPDERPAERSLEMKPASTARPAAKKPWLRPSPSATPSTVADNVKGQTPLELVQAPDIVEAALDLKKLTMVDEGPEAVTVSRRELLGSTKEGNAAGPLKPPGALGPDLVANDPLSSSGQEDAGPKGIKISKQELGESILSPLTSASMGPTDLTEKENNDELERCQVAEKDRLAGWSETGQTSTATPSDSVAKKPLLRPSPSPTSFPSVVEVSHVHFSPSDLAASVQGQRTSELLQEPPMEGASIQDLTELTKVKEVQAVAVPRRPILRLAKKVNLVTPARPTTPPVASATIKPIPSSRKEFAVPEGILTSERTPPPSPSTDLRVSVGKEIDNELQRPHIAERDRLSGWSEEVKAAIYRSEAALKREERKTPSEGEFDTLLQQQKADMGNLLKRPSAPVAVSEASPTPAEVARQQLEETRPIVPRPKPPSTNDADSAPVKQLREAAFVLFDRRRVSSKEEEDRDWARAEALHESKAIEDVVFVAANAAGMLVSFGCLVGFLPAWELSAKRRLPSFTAWAEEKGFSVNHPLSTLRKNEPLTTEPSVEVTVSEATDETGKSSKDADYKELLRNYREERASLLSALVGETARVTVIALERERRQLRLSEKIAEGEDQEMAQKKAQLMASLSVGDVVSCVVKKVTSFGAFVEVQGVPALIHISELSWNRITDPTPFTIAGQELEVKVCKLDRYLQRINLSLKQMQPDPLRETLESLVSSDANADSESEEIDVGIQDISELNAVIKRLEEIEGIISVTKGRKLRGSAMAPTFQVYLSRPLENGFKLLARSGNQVQEVLVETSLGRKLLKEAICKCTVMDS